MVEAARRLVVQMSAFGIEIAREQICVVPDGASKHDALEALIEAVSTNPVVKDVAAFRRAVYEREGIMSTGIGEGIAIPHVRIPEITEATLGVGIAPAGIDFDTLDNKPVHVLVLFATPAGSDKEYLRLLAQVMLSLRDRDLFHALVACQTPDDVYGVLNG